MIFAHQGASLPWRGMPAATRFPTAGEATVETYIVRIYHRKARKGRGMLGWVELVDREEKRVFSNPDELCRIIYPEGTLHPAPLEGARKKKKSTQR